MPDEGRHQCEGARSEACHARSSGYLKHERAEQPNTRARKQEIEGVVGEDSVAGIVQRDEDSDEFHEDRAQCIDREVVAG